VAVFEEYICFLLLMLVSANIPGKRNGVAKVAGSNPVTPTNTKTVACVYRSGRFFMPVISAQKLAPSDRGQGVFGTVVLITPSYLARGMLFTHVLRWGRAINLALYGRRVL
jgi:hypothetical protein